MAFTSEDDGRLVERHYTRGTLAEAILELLATGGKELDRLSPGDLAPVDEFHVGGRQATIDFAAQLQFAPDAHLLDVGSGLGGPSRYFALDGGCRVTGIDITEEYVKVAAMLSQKIGLDGRTSYYKGSALALPFGTASFDGAYMLHVGMNIRDKAALFAEIRRVLRRGTRFGIYDVMRRGDVELTYPLPWAASAEAGFVEPVVAYRRLLEAAGFTVEAERSRLEFAVDFFEQMRARSVAGQALGLHLLMGQDAATKIANMVGALSNGLIEPVEIVCRASN